jgi:hypothetical protein
MTSSTVHGEPPADSIAIERECPITDRRDCIMAHETAGLEHAKETLFRGHGIVRRTVGFRPRPLQSVSVPQAKG